MGGGSADLTRLRGLGNKGLSAVNTLFRTRFTDLCYGASNAGRLRSPALALDCDGFEIETLMNVRAVKAPPGVRSAQLRASASPRPEQLAQ